MTLALGIDTGGTFTDAVLVDVESGLVWAGAKALTTRHDLAIGIGQAIRRVLAEQAAGGAVARPGDIGLVGLSTTLATNTLAEGQRAPVCLLLIGYDPELITRFDLGKDLAADNIVYLRGGHDVVGNQAQPLDEEQARAEILAHSDQVEAFAISSYFSVRNPEHERRVRALVQELTRRPVTCGHELSSKLDSVRRATTAALNASLIVPLEELIASVRATLAELGIGAPLMVVKGDGSLVRAEWAVQRPIETILSGPAASVLGAWRLSGQADMWAVDVGGTTTDIAALHAGRPALNDEGAVVNGWRTMVEAIAVHTTGLGGDSQVRRDSEGMLHLGPRRVVPLSLLAHEHPAALAELERALAAPADGANDGTTEFFVLARRSAAGHNAADNEILQRLAHGPLSLAQLAGHTRHVWRLRRQCDALASRGLVRRAGFTPTDALHALGRLSLWHVQAAQVGAGLLARQAGQETAAFCEEVVATVGRRIAGELVAKVVADETPPGTHTNQAEQPLLQRALHPHTSQLGAALTLAWPLVAIGAPVAAYMPDVARYLHTELVIPPHAEVANAVGAVVGGVIQRRRVLILPSQLDRLVRLHLPDGVHEFETIEEAVVYAEAAMRPYVEQQAREAGATQVDVQVARHDKVVVAPNDNQEVNLETELVFTASGRPGVAPPAMPAPDEGEDG